MSALADSFSGLDDNKIWSVSLSLRGFYSDNVDTAAKGRTGFGFDVNPSARVHLSSPQTDFTAGYAYDATYYDKRPAGNTDHFDQNHTFDFTLQHQFSERYSLTVNDTFAVGQQPDELTYMGPFSQFERISGNNIHNYGSINLDVQLTHLFGIELGYDNSWWDYESHKTGQTVFNPLSLPAVPIFISPSLAGLNNRIEQSAHLDTHWSVTEKTVLIVGYQFTDVEYTGNEAIQAINPNISISNTNLPNIYKSDVRNSYSHYGYIGATHSFLPSLTGSIKIGARYTENYNDPNGTTSIEPYVSLNVSYNYARESYVQLGFSHDRSSNDRAGGGGTNVVQDSDTSVVFATLHQKITPKLSGTLTGTFQDSVINAPGNPINGEDDRFYNLALDFEYKFTQYFSMHAGYTYDRLEAGTVSGTATGSYDKNTIYLGATIGY